MFPYENVCLISEQPRLVCLDSFAREGQLHTMEGKPAIKFADGYSLYGYHGMPIPEKYGQLHPSQWQAKFILEEQNSALRRRLIQEIGYERICQELQATELDVWQEYTLIFSFIVNQPNIDMSIDVIRIEPNCLVVIRDRCLLIS